MSGILVQWYLSRVQSTQGIAEQKICVRQLGFSPSSVPLRPATGCNSLAPSPPAADSAALPYGPPACAAAVASRRLGFCRHCVNSRRKHGTGTQTFKQQAHERAHRVCYTQCNAALQSLCLPLPMLPHVTVSPEHWDPNTDPALAAIPPFAIPDARTPSTIEKEQKSLKNCCRSIPVHTPVPLYYIHEMPSHQLRAPACTHPLSGADLWQVHTRAPMYQLKDPALHPHDISCGPLHAPT